MRCLKCDSTGWIKRTVTVPVFVYGELRQAIVTRVCPVCLGSGEVKVKKPVQTLDRTLEE